MKKLLVLVAALATLSACHGGTADYSNVNQPEYAYGQSTDTANSNKMEEHFNHSQRK